MLEEKLRTLVSNVLRSGNGTAAGVRQTLIEKAVMEGKLLPAGAWDVSSSGTEIILAHPLTAEQEAASEARLDAYLKKFDPSPQTREIPKQTANSQVTDRAFKRALDTISRKFLIGSPNAEEEKMLAAMQRGESKATPQERRQKKLELWVKSLFPEESYQVTPAGIKMLKEISNSDKVTAMRHISFYLGQQKESSSIGAAR